MQAMLDDDHPDSMLLDDLSKCFGADHVLYYTSTDYQMPLLSRQRPLQGLGDSDGPGLRDHWPASAAVRAFLEPLPQLPLTTRPGP